MGSKLISYVSRMQREKKYKQFISFLGPFFQGMILDVGPAAREHLESHNLLEKNYPYKNRIVALGIGNLTNFKRRYPEIVTICYDGIRFPFKDRTFEVVYCNAVLEHVGNYEIQQKFINEIARTCKKVFITTPNRFFPLELHTMIPLVHFFPKMICDYILRLCGQGWVTGDYMHLLTLNQFKSLFPTKRNLKIIRNRLLFFTITFTALLEGQSEG